MKINIFLEDFKKKKGFKPTLKVLSEITGTSASALSNRIFNDGNIKQIEQERIEDFYGIDVTGNNDCIPLTYRPDVYLSAGYGVEVLDEHKEIMMIDSRLLISDHGNKINPKNCEIVRVSGNSMSPEYKHGDRVIIDKGDVELLDGHIFAFRYKECCYVKELNLLGDRIKCISLNKEYDPFYIEKGEQFTVLGRIIPRVRL